MASFAAISDSALQRVDSVATLASQWVANTLTRMDTMATEADAVLSEIDSLVYSPDFVELIAYAAPDDPMEPDYTSEGPADPIPNVLNTVSAFSYSELPYTDLVKSEIQTAIQNVLGGTVIVGSTIWDAIWARVVANFSIQQVGEEWQASDAGAARGWELPSEATTAALAEAEDGASKRTSAAALENAIQQAVQYREDHWNAVQQGIPFEQTHQQHHNNVWNRELEAAKEAVGQAIRINEMLIAQDNLNVQVYLAKWDGLAKRISSTATMLEARTRVKTMNISSEQTRLEYNKTKHDVAFKTEDGEADISKVAARLKIENVIGVVSSLATLASGMAQAALSASDVSVSTGASISENWSIAGPI